MTFVARGGRYYAFAHMHVNMFNNEEYDGSSVNGVWGQGAFETANLSQIPYSKTEHLSRQARDDVDQEKKRKARQGKELKGKEKKRKERNDWLFVCMHASCLRAGMLFEPFIYKSNLFTKTGSGQT